MNQEKTKHWLGVLYVNCATLAWASNMVMGRVLKDAIGPITLASARFVVASVIFALLLRQQPAADRKIGNDRLLLIGMALTGVVLFSPALYLGLRYTSAVNGTLINGIGPLMTGAMAAAILHQPMSRRQVVGALVGLVGVAYLITNGTADFWQNAQFNVGDFIVLFSVAIWGLYSVMGSRVMRKRSTISTTALSTLLGLPILILLSFWEMRHIPVNFDAKLLLGIVYLGIVPAAGGFYAWNAGVSRLGPGGAMVFYNTLPLYGALLGVTLLGEPLGLSHGIGGLLIIGGSLWAAKR